MKAGVRDAFEGGDGVRPKAAGFGHGGMGFLGPAALLDRVWLRSNGWHGPGAPLSAELGAVSRSRSAQDSRTEHH